MFFGQDTPIVANVVNVSSTDDRRQFITQNVHLCLQHDGRDAQRVARFVCDS